MNRKQLGKITVDVGMTAVLLLLMAYSLVGEAAHEWLGIGMFALFIIHHILNSAWCRNVFKGKYTPFRIWQTALIVLVLACMLGSVVSGIIISRHALAFLSIPRGQSWARTLHMLSAYWGFVFMSLHLGLHWSMMMSMARRMGIKLPVPWSWAVRIVGCLIAGYGVYAFVKREIGNYMLLRTQFVFFDFGEPLILFLLDYIAVMGLFVLIGHYISKRLRSFK